MLLSSRTRVESPEILSLAGFRILLLRVKPVLAGRKFSDHSLVPRLCGIDFSLCHLRKHRLKSMPLKTRTEVRTTRLLYYPAAAARRTLAA